MSVPRQLTEMPISAPLWLWLLYGATVIALCFLGGFLAPIFTAMFSFQFWTYATWRGLCRAEDAEARQ